MDLLMLGKYKVQVQGGSFRVTVPKLVIDNWDLHSGDEVFIYLADDQLIISKKELKELKK